MSRPVETGVDVALSENRGIVSELQRQRLEHCGLQAYPMTPVMQWEVSWALEQGRN